MENRPKLVIIILAAILFISLILSFGLYNANVRITREWDNAKRENDSLTKANKALEERIRVVEDDSRQLKLKIDAAGKEKAELQQKIEQMDKERQALIEKLKENQKAAAAPAEGQNATLSSGGDAYWAGVLKAKTELEVQLEDVRKQLKLAEITQEQLTRERAGLDLEINSLKRDNEDLSRQIEYHKKLVSSITQDFVREKNDKMQTEDSFKLLKNENIILKRQLNGLNSRKNGLEIKVQQLQDENAVLSRRFNEMNTMLEERITKASEIKNNLEDMNSREPADVQDSQRQPDNQKPAQGQDSSVELPPIVVKPQTEMPFTAGMARQGRIAAVNRENNFVIIDIGQSAGVKLGEAIKVYRDGSVIAEVEVIQVRQDISACDIRREQTPIKPGDIVR